MRGDRSPCSSVFVFGSQSISHHLRPSLVAISLLALGAFIEPAHALEDCGTAPRQVATVELDGFEATRESTALALLPRGAPATFSLLELDEFERRLNNLGIFDA